MSKFKVGDRVKCTCGDADACTVQGRVVGIEDNGEARVACDNGEEVTWRTKYLALVAPAPPVAVAPTLETATGAELDRIARDMLKVYRVPGTPDADFRADLLEMAPRGRPVKCGDFQIQVYDVDRPPLSPSSSVTKAEWADAHAQLDAMRAALDTVRRFLGSHSFAACSLACNRELREVMAVVLAALDAERAGK